MFLNTEYDEKLQSPTLTLHDARNALRCIVSRMEEIDKDAPQDGSEPSYDLLFDALCDEIGALWNERPTQIVRCEFGPVNNPHQAVADCIRIIRALCDPHMNNELQRKEALELVERIEAANVVQSKPILEPTTYRVVWEIDIEAETPREAAEKARAAQTRQDTIATVFDVHANGEVYRVDLTDEAESYDFKRIEPTTPVAG